MKDYGCGLVMADGSFCESFEGTLNLCSHCMESFLERVEQLENAQQNMHWTAGIVRRFKHFPVVKFVLSLWRSLASRQ